MLGLWSLAQQVRSLICMLSVLIGFLDRPSDIDPAFLRRMPKRFAIRLPDATQRRSILSLVSAGFRKSTHSHELTVVRWQMLRDIPLDKSFNLDAVVRRTDGLSGSDLKEACRSTFDSGAF